MPICKATEQFTIALQNDPKLTEAHEQLGLLSASRQNFAEAAEHFRIAAELRPDEDRLKLNLAMALSRLGKDAEAWQALSELVNKTDVPPMALLLAAKSLENLKRYPETIPLLEQFLVREPNARDVAQQLELMRRRAKENSDKE